RRGPQPSSWKERLDHRDAGDRSARQTCGGSVLTLESVRRLPPRTRPTGHASWPRRGTIDGLDRGRWPMVSHGPKTARATHERERGSKHMSDEAKPQEPEDLSVSEKILRVQELWDDIARSSQSVDLSAAQREE